MSESLGTGGYRTGLGAVLPRVKWLQGSLCVGACSPTGALVPAPPKEAGAAANGGARN
jgi:hypothetical protein